MTALRLALAGVRKAWASLDLWWAKLRCRWFGHKWAGAQTTPSTHHSPPEWDGWCDRCGTTKED